MKRWTRYRQLPAIALLTVLTLSLGVTIVRAESGSGQVDVYSPVVKSIGIYLPSQPDNLTAIDVDTEYVFKVTVNDTALLTNILNITLRLYTNSWGAVDTAQRHYSFLWKYSDTPHFSQIGPSGTYLVLGDCVTPTLDGQNQGVFEFALKMDKLAINTDVNGWTVKAEAFDTFDPPGMGWRAIEFQMNQYSSLTIPTSVTWAGAPGNTYQGNPSTDHITYTTNFVTKIQVEATTPTSAHGDTFAVSNIMIDKDSQGGSKHSFSDMVTGYSDWLTTQSNEVADKQVNCYWFVSIPAGQASGTYTFTYYMRTYFESYPLTTLP
jgi:hypothetical protein